MAKKNPQRGLGSAPRRGKRKQSTATSPAIPIVVGVVLVIVVFGVLLSLDSWRSAPAESAANPTALPMATLPIPYPDVPRISVQDAQEKLSAGEIVMVDVRSETSYDALHIEGAISIPENQIESRLGELDRESNIVLYCT